MSGTFMTPFRSDPVRHRGPNPRPGIVIDIDEDSPAIAMAHGSTIRTVQLPAGRARVLYAAEPQPSVVDPRLATAHALDLPVDGDPLSERLRSVQRLSIVVADSHHPEPAPGGTDPRQILLEAILDRAAAAAIDDVTILIANGLRRRLTHAELRSILGPRVFDAFVPHGGVHHFHRGDGASGHELRYPDGVVDPGMATRVVAPQLLDRDLVISVGLIGGPDARHGWDLLIDGATGPANGTDSFSINRGALIEALRHAGVDLFSSAAVINNAHRHAGDPRALLDRREHEWNAADRIRLRALSPALAAIPTRILRDVDRRIAVERTVLGIATGSPDAVAAHLEPLIRSQYELRDPRLGSDSAAPAPPRPGAQDAPVNGTDIVALGLSNSFGLAAGSIPNPVTAAAEGIARAADSGLARPAGVAIISFPLVRSFHPVHHPAYIDFVDEVLPDTTDPAEMRERFGERFAHDSWFAHLHATSFAHAGLHPFAVWEELRAHQAQFDQIIMVGGDPEVVRTLGLRPASTLGDALEMATDAVGTNPSVSVLHDPARVWMAS